MTASEFKRPVGHSRRATGELIVRPKFFLSCCGMCVSFQLVIVAFVFYVWRYRSTFALLKLVFLVFCDDNRGSHWSCSGRGFGGTPGEHHPKEHEPQYG